MRQMQDFPETSAIHDWIENQQYQRQQSEKAEKRHRDYRYDLSPQTCYQRSTEQCLHKGHEIGHRLGGKIHKADMEEIIVLAHHQSRSYRIEELEHSRNEKYDSYDVAAETLASFQYPVHVISDICPPLP